MANELRVRQNFLGGLVEDNPLTSSATTITSAALAAAPSIGTTQHMPIVLDPDGLYGEPEITYITAHTSGGTTATVLRGQEGTTARQHQQDVPWSHGPTVYDLTPRVIGARAYRSASLTASTGGFSTVPLDTESFDTHNMHDLSTSPEMITVTFTGTYLIAGCVAFNNSNTTGLRHVRVTKNGQSTVLLYNVLVPFNYVVRVPVVGTAVLAAGDTIQMGVFQDSGVSLEIGTAAATETYLSAIYQGA